MRQPLRTSGPRALKVVIGLAVVTIIGAATLASRADEAACKDREENDPCTLRGGAHGACQVDDSKEGVLECDPPGLAAF